MSQLYEQIDENIEVYFLTMQDEKQSGGDITSKYGVNPKKIEELIDKLFVDPFLKKNGFYAKDLMEIIQIVDVDGVYIPEENVIFSEETGDDTIYKNDSILTDRVNAIRERNMRKRDNLNLLMSLDAIKIDSKSIKYSVYYFSSNLDHYLHNNANLELRNKRQLAQDFSTKYVDNTEAFANVFLKDADAATDKSYDESWGIHKTRYEFN
jgi:hypothetical protein